MSFNQKEAAELVRALDQKVERVELATRQLVRATRKALEALAELQEETAEEGLGAQTFTPVGEIPSPPLLGHVTGKEGGDE